MIQEGGSRQEHSPVTKDNYDSNCFGSFLSELWKICSELIFHENLSKNYSTMRLLYDYMLYDPSQYN